MVSEMGKRRAKLLVVLAFASAMPLVTFACSGDDPLLGFRQPNPPRPDTGRDNMVQPMDGTMGGEAGEGGEGSTTMDAPADTTKPPDTGIIDTGILDTGIDSD